MTIEDEKSVAENELRDKGYRNFSLHYNPDSKFRQWVCKINDGKNGKAEFAGRSARDSMLKAVANAGMPITD